MKVSFQQVIPNPMKGEPFSQESVWGNTCEVDSSNRYFLISGSGKGKSTFAAYFLGLRFDYSGTILINGTDQKQMSLDDWSDLRQRKIGFLAQDMRLFPNLTVLENLQIKNKLTDYASEGEILKRLQRIEMDHKVDQMAGTLSLGQQQRVALVRSLLQPFELLLMDEPFSHIDQENITRAIELITEECDKQQAGYVLTSLGYDYGITTNKFIYL